MHGLFAVCSAHCVPPAVTTAWWRELRQPARRSEAEATGAARADSSGSCGSDRPDAVLSSNVARGNRRTKGLVECYGISRAAVELVDWRSVRRRLDRRYVLSCACRHVTCTVLSIAPWRQLSRNLNDRCFTALYRGIGDCGGVSRVPLPLLSVRSRNWNMRCAVNRNGDIPLCASIAALVDAPVCLCVPPPPFAQRTFFVLPWPQRVVASCQPVQPDCVGVRVVAVCGVVVVVVSLNAHELQRTWKKSARVAALSLN